MQNNAVADLSTWVATQLRALSGSDVDVALAPLSGDAGFRRYYRVQANTQSPMLAVISPPESENNPLFVELAKALRGHVCTPTIYAADYERGFLLIEDFGDQLLWRSLQQQPEGADGLYGEALMDLLALQQERPYHIDLPCYSPSMLQAEMNLFTQWFVGRLLSLPTDTLTPLLAPVHEALIANALAQPQVFVHRDYHSRNLIERAGRPLGVIDFQGAVWGPISYDVVSLLKDCYICWPEEKVRNWVACYGQLAFDAELMPKVDPDTFYRWFELTGLQRHLKVLGIFARLALRDNKSAYLNDLPLVLHYVRTTARRYPSTQPLANLLDEQLLPAMVEQPWYTPWVNAAK